MRQALLDVCSQSHPQRINALMYFNQNMHEDFCSTANIDAEELRDSVMNACRWNEGEQRKEAVKKILKDLGDF